MSMKKLMSHRLHALALVAGLAVPFVGITTAFANDVVAFQTVYGTDFTTAGTGGLRGSGTGTLTVASATGSATRSLLFWHGPTNSSDPNANAHVTVNGIAVAGANIGFSSDNFWGFRNSQAYRADTTNVITGNGAYDLTNFNNPPDVEVNGAAVALFSNDGNAATKRDVVIFNGNDSNFESDFDSAGWDVNLSGINYSGGSAYLTLFVSDGQHFSTTDDGTLRINGIALASGGLFQGDSLPGGTGPDDNGNLFDIRTFDISSFLALGPNALHITLDNGTDALSLVAAFIDLPAGAAPIPEPQPLVLVVLGMTMLGLRRRRAN